MVNLDESNQLLFKPLFNSRTSSLHHSLHWVTFGSLFAKDQCHVCQLKVDLMHN
uniref:Uncharacterized protein n=1 Tax=Tetranychus urticae TaxID=32264 RepID=T1KWU4_TETUR